MPSILLGLLLIEVAKSFNTSIGVMGQIRTASSIMGIIISIFMGVLSVKYRYKPLLLSGLTILILSSILCSYSTSFEMMLVSSAFLGAGMSVTSPMISALVGQHLTSNQRASALGWFNGAAALAYLIGSPTIAILSGLSGWREVFQLFIMPLFVFTFSFTYKGVPPYVEKNPGEKDVAKIFDGYRAVLNNSSAITCLIGNVSSMSIWSSFLVFSSSFIRETFLLSTMLTSLSTIIGASLYIGGSISCGYLVNRYGLRKVSLFASIPSGMFILFYYNNPNLWATLIFGYLAALCNGLLLSAISVFTLEQVPYYSGTMMSLSSAAGGLGSAIGTGFVGWLIISRGYGASGQYFILMSIITFIVYFYLKDPRTRVLVS